MINLTEREKEVMELVSLGLNNEEIQNKLHISKSTMNTHMHNIYSKYLLEMENTRDRSVLRLRLVLKWYGLI